MPNLWPTNYKPKAAVAAAQHKIPTHLKHGKALHIFPLYLNSTFSSLHSINGNVKGLEGLDPPLPQVFQHNTAFDVASVEICGLSSLKTNLFQLSTV